MMAGVRSWVMSVVAVGMLVSLCLGLSPGGKVQKVSRFCGGLLLFLAVVTPLTRLDVTGALEDFRAYCDQLSEPSEPLVETSVTLTQELVTARAETSIQTKAREMGADVTVTVVCQSRDGLPVPEEVTLTGAVSAKQQKTLMNWIEASFALPVEQIHFQAEETEGKQ